jgi:hypothetical protein
VEEGLTPFVRGFAAHFALPFVPTTVLFIWVWSTTPSLSQESIEILSVGDVAVALGWATFIARLENCRRIRVTPDGIILRPDTPRAMLWSWSNVSTSESSKFSLWLFGTRQLFRLLDGGTIVDACYFTSRQTDAILSYPGRPSLAPLSPINWGLQTG